MEAEFFKNFSSSYDDPEVASRVRRMNASRASDEATALRTLHGTPCGVPRSHFLEHHFSEWKNSGEVPSANDTFHGVLSTCESSLILKAHSTNPLSTTRLTGWCSLRTENGVLNVTGISGPNPYPTAQRALSSIQVTGSINVSPADIRMNINVADRFSANTHCQFMYVRCNDHPCTFFVKFVVAPMLGRGPTEEVLSASSLADAVETPVSGHVVDACDVESSESRIATLFELTNAFSNNVCQDCSQIGQSSPCCVHNFIRRFSETDFISWMICKTRLISQSSFYQGSHNTSRSRMRKIWKSSRDYHLMVGLSAHFGGIIQCMFEDINSWVMRKHVRSYIARDENDGLCANAWNYLKAKITSTCSAAYDTAKEWISNLIERLKGYANVLSDYLGDGLKTALRKICAVIRDFLTSFITDEMVSIAGQLAKVGLIVGVLWLSIITVSGFVSRAFATKVIVSICNIGNAEFVARGNLPPVAVITGLLSVMLGGFYGNEKNRLTEVVKNVMLVSAGAAAVGVLFKSVICALPAGIKCAVINRYGTKSMIAEFNAEQWIPKAHAMIKVSTMTKAITDASYHKNLMNMVTSYKSIANNVKPATRNQMHSLYMHLIRLSVNSFRYQKESKERCFPFVWHVAAAPGVGKTLFTEKFIKDCFDLSKRKIYWRPNASEFWDAFAGEKVVGYDEFLVGKPTDTTIDQQMKEFLTLCSTAGFKPPLASLNDPSVGVKGESACPEFVFTLNNTVYNRPGGHNAEAFQRRRQFVIEAALTSDAIMKNDGINVDLGKYSEDQMAVFKWMKFRMLSPVHDANYKNVPWYSYTELVTAVKAKYKEHAELCSKIKNVLGQNLGELTSEELVDGVLKDACYTEDDNSNIFTSVIKWMLGDLEARGNLSKRKRLRRKRTVTLRARGPARTPSSSSDTETDYSAAPADAETAVSSHVVGSADAVETPVSSYVVEPADAVETSVSSHAVNPADAVETFLFSHVVGSADAVETSVSGHVVDSADAVETSVSGHVVDLPFSSNVSADAVETHVSSHVVDSTLRSSASADAVETSVSGHVVERPLIKESIVRATKFRSPPDVNIASSSVPDTSILLDSDLDSCAGLRHYRRNGYTDDSSDYSDASSSTCFLDDVFSQDSSSSMHSFKTSLDAYYAKGKHAFAQCVDLIYTTYFPVDSSSSRPWYYQLLGVTSVIALGYAVYRVISRIISFVSGKTPEMVARDTYRHGSKQTPAPRPSGGFSRYDHAPDSVARGNRTEPVIMVINDHDRVYCLPIRDRWIVTYRHCLDKYDPDSSLDLTFIYKSQTSRCRAKPSDFYQDSDRDLLLFKITDLKHQSYPNCLKQFVSSQEMADFSYCRGTLVKDTAATFGTMTKVVNQHYSNSGKRIHLSEAIHFEFVAVNGDCGLAFRALTGPCADKIIAILVASPPGGIASSLGTLIYRDLVVKLIDSVDSQETMESRGNDFTKYCHIGNDDPPLIVTQGKSKTPLNLSGPNLVAAWAIPKGERVAVSTKTKYKRSILSDHLTPIFDSGKTPAILSQSDPRAQHDPLVVGLNNLFEAREPEIDSALLEQVVSVMEKNYERDLRWPFGKRMMTFEEAVGGVDTYLTPIRNDTCAGFPYLKLAKRKGKRDLFFKDPDGNLKYEPSFRFAVDNVLNQLLRGETPAHRWIGYLKDDLVSRAKIESCKTRLTWAGDVTVTVALRMMYGSLLAAVCHSNPFIPICIGMNQFSHDMETVHAYLTGLGGTKMIAGDYKSWDQQVVKSFQKAAYELVHKLVRGVEPRISNAVFQCQTQCMGQLANVGFYTNKSHYSGCLLTTIVGSLVNEMYWRYMILKLYPSVKFDECIRMVTLSDDHVVCFKDIDLTGPRVQKFMATLDQTYTSDIKEEPVIADWRHFEDITLLGACPRLVDGFYSGALKKSTLYESLCWTRDDNHSIVSQIMQMIELASQHDEPFFQKFKSQLVEACLKEKIELPAIMEYSALATLVAGRRACHQKSVCFVPLYEARGNDGGITDTGLTTLVTETVEESASISVTKDSSLRNISAVPDIPLSYGCESWVQRATYSWTKDQAAGTRIFALELPGALLALGNTGNVQNMPFERHYLARFSIEVMLQVMGTQFYQGLSIMYFDPLRNNPSTDFKIAPAFSQSVFLTPGMATSAVIKIPFNYPAPNMPLDSGALIDDLGTLYLQVMSPLKVGSSSETAVNLTLYTRFPDATFSVPRVQTASELLKQRWLLTNQLPALFPMKHLREVCEDFQEDADKLSDRIRQMDFVSRGNVSSVHNVWKGTFGNVSTELSAHATQDLNAKADLHMPMDNPNVGGNAAPVVLKYPSMAKNRGPEFTNVMALDPGQVLLQHKLASDTAPDSNIESICNRWSVLDISTINLDTKAGSTVYTFPLNSVLQKIQTGNRVYIPLCCGVLSSFCYFRCDFELQVMAVRTRFHAFRLSVTTAYGDFSTLTNATGYYQSILDYREDISTHTVRLPYNSAVPFMETYSGQFDKIPALRSMGTVTVSLANALRAPETVDSSVQLITLVRATNVQVAVPRPFSPVTFSMPVPTGATDAVFEIGNSPDPGYLARGNSDTEKLPTTSSTSVDAAAGETRSVATPKPYKVDSLAKFPSCVSDLHEVARRFVYRPPVPATTVDTMYKCNAWMKITKSSRTFGIIPLKPAHWANNLFRMWAGSLRYRIFSEKIGRVLFFPRCDVTVDSAATVSATYGIDGLLHYFLGVTAPIYVKSTVGGVVSARTCTANANYVDGMATMCPEEIGFDTSTDSGWINITVPCYTPFERVPMRWAESLPGTPATSQYYGFVSGTVVFEILQDTNSVTKVYSSVSDDFQYSVFAPPANCYWGLNIPTTVGFINAVTAPFYGLQDESLKNASSGEEEFQKVSHSDAVPPVLSAGPPQNDNRMTSSQAFTRFTRM